MKTKIHRKIWWVIYLLIGIAVGSIVTNLYWQKGFENFANSIIEFNIQIIEVMHRGKK